MSMSEGEYIGKVLTAYLRTPTTAGRVHAQDRRFAAELFRRGIPLDVVENALILGAVRRLYRDPNAEPLAPVRSLNYFRSIIDEVCKMGVPADYFRYLRHKIETFEESKRRS
jgi:hypothetical protein